MERGTKRHTRALGSVGRSATRRRVILLVPAFKELLDEVPSFAFRGSDSSCHFVLCQNEGITAGNRLAGTGLPRLYLWWSGWWDDYLGRRRPVAEPRLCFQYLVWSTVPLQPNSPPFPVIRECDQDFSGIRLEGHWCRWSLYRLWLGFDGWSCLTPGPSSGSSFNGHGEM